MKKKLFLMACLTVWSILAAKAQLSVATLHHEGNVTIYSGSQIQTAIDNAVAGDTIYLSEGVFDGFTVAKDIAIIGSGVTTVIQEVVKFGSVSNLVLNNILFTREISETNSDVALNGIRFNQCVIDYLHFYIKQTPSIEIRHSYIKEVNFSNNTSRISNSAVTFINCKVNQSGGIGTFINCNISNAEGGPTCQNCIIVKHNSGVNENCLVKNNDGDLIHSYIDSNFTLNEDLDCSLTDAELVDKGYLGTDGKVVGINGGEIPFTLASPILQVIEHEITPDNVNKKLKVTLKLGNK